MSTHAKLSPSSAERWWNCPGSLNLIATLPEAAFTTSIYAVEGTVAHQLAEDFVTRKIDLVTLTGRCGEVVMQDGVEVEITDSMIEGVIEYFDYIAMLKKRLRKPTLIIEKAEVKAIASSVTEEVYGTADYLLYQKGNELHVIDFKFGKGVVEAEENKQGMTYLVGAQDTEAGAAFDRVFFHIVQPRARHNDGSARLWELPTGRLDAFRKELAAAVARTKDPSAPRVAGEKWCRFCPALGWTNKKGAFVCPESRKSIEGAAQMVFSKVEAEKQLPDPQTLAPDQLAHALDWEELVDSFFKRARECAASLLAADPNAVPGYKLVEGKTNRSWIDETQAEEAFVLLGKDRYAPKKLKTPAQMEKCIGKEEVAKHTVKLPGKLTVAKSSDKRATASSAGEASAVFGAIETTAETVPLDDTIFGDLAGPAEPKETTKKEPMWPS